MFSDKTIGERFTDLRKSKKDKHGKDMPTIQLARELSNEKYIKGYAADVIRQEIGKVENNGKFPQLFLIKGYCKYFNVTSDYLLGIRDTKPIDENIAMINKVTGLSDEAIQILKEWNELKKKPIDIIAGYGGADIDALNLLLEDCYYRSKKADRKGYMAGWSIFHHIYNYFFSEHLKKHPHDTVQYVHEPELRNGEYYIRRELKNGDVIISDGVKRTVEKIETYEGGHKSTSDKFPVYNEENPKETYIMSFSEIIETHTKDKILKTLERIKNRIKERK